MDAMEWQVQGCQGHLFYNEFVGHSNEKTHKITSKNIIIFGHSAHRMQVAGAWWAGRVTVYTHGVYPGLWTVLQHHTSAHS